MTTTTTPDSSPPCPPASAPVVREEFLIVPPGLPYSGCRLENMRSTSLLRVVVHLDCPPGLVVKIREIFFKRLTSPDQPESDVEHVRTTSKQCALERAQILEALQRAGPIGLTDGELAERTGLTYGVVSSRRETLTKRGLVVQAGNLRQRARVWIAVTPTTAATDGVPP